MKDTKATKPTDGKTIELIRRGLINANTGKVDKNKAIRAGLIPPASKKEGGKK